MISKSLTLKVSKDIAGCPFITFVLYTGNELKPSIAVKSITVPYELLSVIVVTGSPLFKATLSALSHKTKSDTSSGVPVTV